jgi:hypothetical protein
MAAEEARRHAWHFRFRKRLFERGDSAFLLRSMSRNAYVLIVAICQNPRLIELQRIASFTSTYRALWVGPAFLSAIAIEPAGWPA